MQTLTDSIRFIESVFGPGKLARNCKNFDVRCPICAPRDHSKKKLAIHIEDHRCHCWTCGYKAGTLAPLIFKHGSHEQFAEYKKLFMSERQRSRFFQTLDDTQHEIPKIQLPNGTKLLAQAGTSNPDVRAMLRYLFDRRGITERDLWYFKLCYTEHDLRWKRRIIMPSFDEDGNLNYFVGRAIDNQRRPKYDNPDDDKLSIIFNAINIDWTTRLTICEGCFDLVKCNDNAVPLLGSDLNEQSALFNAILTNGTPIALALDSDMWYTKTQSIAKKLVEYNIDVVIVDTREFGDPGNATKSQFKQAYQDAKPFSWLNSFKIQLERASHTSLTIR